MARRRRSLGSAAAAHTRGATVAAIDIKHASALTIEKARDGRCSEAFAAHNEMQRVIGEYSAHVVSGGRGGVEPSRAIVDAEREFADRCIRDDGALSGRRGRRR